MSSARPPVIALKDVRLADGPRMLFDGVDLGLEPRVRACLVGRNGAGKSTLLRMLAGLIEPDGGARFVSPNARVVMVPQEPEVVGDTLLDYATADGAETHEAEANLTAFGLDPARSTQGLSGGEIRRASLAKAFAEHPDVLLLDEPTNHLDIFAIQTLEEELAACRAACLIVSHDRAFLERMTKRCFWLENRRLYRLDKGFAHFDDWADQIAEAEVETSRKLDKALEREQRWMERGVTARRARNEGRRRRLLALREEKAARMRASRGPLSLGQASGDSSGKLVIDAERIAKRWGEKVVLKEFSTRIQRGDRVAIVGPNGAGKTTLVKLLLGEIEADSGTTKLGTRLQVAYVDQARAELAADATLKEVLAPGGDQVMVRGNPRHVSAYAKDFLFRESQLRQPVASLSGGERNRLLLAKALAQPANLLVLDEPTNDLDMETLDRLEDLLADYEGALILVSHDRDFIDKLATSTIALDGYGRAVENPRRLERLPQPEPRLLRARRTPLHRFAVPLPQGGGTAAARSEPVPPPLGEGDQAKPGGEGSPPPRPGKLSYKDQRRLDELEKHIAELPATIAKLERRLEDPGLYAKDPAAFDRIMKSLDKGRADLAHAEEEWLALAEKREALGG